MFANYEIDDLMNSKTSYLNFSNEPIYLRVSFNYYFFCIILNVFFLKDKRAY
jgi:hypothetical protein